MAANLFLFLIEAHFNFRKTSELLREVTNLGLMTNMGRCPRGMGLPLHAYSS